MNIEQAQELIKQNNASYSYNLYVPSLEKEISFKDLKIGQIKSLTKASLESDTKFKEFLGSLITELSSSAINLKDINELDKIIILFGIKFKNSDTKTEFTGKCTECKADNIITVKDHTLGSKKLSFKKELVELKVGDLKISYDIMLPSVYDNIIYSKLIESRKALIENENTSIKLAEMAVQQYETYLLYIRNLKINDEVVQGFDDLSLDQRLDFISNLSENILDIEKINEYASKYINKSIFINNKCKFCEKEMNYYIEPEDFFYN